MKKVLFYAFLLPAFVGMMFSCSDIKTDVKKLEGKWNVVEVKGEKVLEEGLPQMDFNMAEKKLHGNTGCNLFNTTITLDPEDVSSITIAPGSYSRFLPKRQEHDRLGERETGRYLGKPKSDKSR